MFYRIGSGISLLVILIGFMSSVNGVVSISKFLISEKFKDFSKFSLNVSLQRVNITSFKNCDLDSSENLDHFVRFSDISFECNADGFCDILHAKFNIPTVNDKAKLVMYLTKTKS